MPHGVHVHLRVWRERVRQPDRPRPSPCPPHRGGSHARRWGAQAPSAGPKEGPRDREALQGAAFSVGAASALGVQGAGVPGKQPLHVAWDGRSTVDPTPRSLPALGVAPLCWSRQHRRVSAWPSEATHCWLGTPRVPCARPERLGLLRSGPPGQAELPARSRRSERGREGTVAGPGRGLEGGSEWRAHPLVMVGRTKAPRVSWSSEG